MCCARCCSAGFGASLPALCSSFGTGEVIAKAPVGRMGKPEEIAAAVIRLCSDAAALSSRMPWSLTAAKRCSDVRRPPPHFRVRPTFTPPATKTAPRHRSERGTRIDRMRQQFFPSGYLRAKGSGKVPGFKTSGWTSREWAQNEKALVAQGLSKRAGDRGRTGDVQLGKEKQPVRQSLRKLK